MSQPAVRDAAAIMEISGPNVDAVLRIMDEMERAWSDKNLTELFKHYWHDDGFVLFTSRGANYGWDAARKMLEHYFRDLDEVTLKFGPRKVRVFGEAATVVYEWRTMARSHDGTKLLRQGYGTDVFLRHNGEWQLYHNHVSFAHPRDTNTDKHS